MVSNAILKLKILHKKIRPVNRLDRNTSGIVVFAKNEYIQECLVEQMRSKVFQKEYVGLCEGIFEEKQGVLTGRIARKKDSIIERQIDPNGETAITHYQVLNETADFSKPTAAESEYCLFTRPRR